MSRRPTQTNLSASANARYFRENVRAYSKGVSELDTYRSIRSVLNQALAGVDRLLDIGNGGVFNYDIQAVNRIVGLDLFLDKIDKSTYPKHVCFQAGSALNIPEREASFDGVLMVMLLHHLVGATVSDCIENVDAAIREALRVLRIGGRLVVIESCIPKWFLPVERLAFPFAARLLPILLSHPVTLQYPASVIIKVLKRYTPSVEVTRIPKGRWVLQYGYKVPGWLTPVKPYAFVAAKEEGTIAALGR